MSLSAMRCAVRPCLRINNSPLLSRGLPMGTSAHDQMKEFWEKNQKLNRPNSPWIIYDFHLPMTTSLTHRITGVTMGVVLYGVAIGSLVAPDFATCVAAVKAMNIPVPVLFTCKTLAAFPLIYHYLNGIRHLAWDGGFGFKLSTQYKTGSIVMVTSLVLSLLLASTAYW